MVRIDTPRNRFLDAARIEVERRQQALNHKRSKLHNLQQEASYIKGEIAAIQNEIKDLKTFITILGRLD